MKISPQATLQDLLTLNKSVQQDKEQMGIGGHGQVVNMKPAEGMKNTASDDSSIDNDSNLLKKAFAEIEGHKQTQAEHLKIISELQEEVEKLLSELQGAATSPKPETPKLELEEPKAAVFHPKIAVGTGA
jgi:hypothetical protein